MAIDELVAATERERDRYRADLATAREALAYVLDHHANGNECLCAAARSVAEAGMRLTATPEKKEPPERTGGVE